MRGRKGEAMKDELGISWHCLDITCSCNPWGRKKGIVGKNLEFPTQWHSQDLLYSRYWYEHFTCSNPVLTDTLHTNLLPILQSEHCGRGWLNILLRIVQQEEKLGFTLCLLHWAVLSGWEALKALILRLLNTRQLPTNDLPCHFLFGEFLFCSGLKEERLS